MKSLERMRCNKVKGQPLLNGLFGVSKHEWEGGVEIHRLIMNLIPVNQVCRNITGDVATLPSLSGLAPLFLGKEEQLVVSSEDVRCFFYIFKIPVEWRRFMAFNKPLPASPVSQGWYQPTLLSFVQRSCLWDSRTRCRLLRISTAT